MDFAILSEEHFSAAPWTVHGRRADPELGCAKAPVAQGKVDVPEFK